MRTCLPCCRHLPCCTQPTSTRTGSVCMTVNGFQLANNAYQANASRRSQQPCGGVETSSMQTAAGNRRTGQRSIKSSDEKQDIHRKLNGDQVEFDCEHNCNIVSTTTDATPLHRTGGPRCVTVNGNRSSGASSSSSSQTSSTAVTTAGGGNGRRHRGGDSPRTAGGSSVGGKPVQMMVYTPGMMTSPPETTTCCSSGGNKTMTRNLFD